MGRKRPTIQHARSLVTQRSGSVAFVLSEPQECLAADPNISVLLRDCSRVLAEQDIGLFACVASSVAERARVTSFVGCPCWAVSHTRR